MVAIGAGQHVLMTAQGAYLKLEGGNIMVHGPGKIDFKASAKELAGPVSINTAENAGKVHELNLRRDLGIKYALFGDEVYRRLLRGMARSMRGVR